MEHMRHTIYILDESLRKDVPLLLKIAYNSLYMNFNIKCTHIYVYRICVLHIYNMLCLISLMFNTCVKLNTLYMCTFLCYR